MSAVGGSRVLSSWLIRFDADRFYCNPAGKQQSLRSCSTWIEPGRESGADASAAGRVVASVEPGGNAAAAEPIVAFASQVLPEAVPCAAASISQWADAACEQISARLDQVSTPWRLHVFATPLADGSTGTGRAKLDCATL